MLLLRVQILVIAVPLSVVGAARGQSGPGDGLKAEITTVSIPAGRRPVVTFRISDGKGRLLELGDLDADSVKFTIAALKAGKNGDRDYRNYLLAKVAGKDYVYKGETRKPALAETLQPGFDQGGVLAKQRPGVFTYTFKTALSPNFARIATHVVGGEMTRGNRRYAANPLYEFVPAGGKVKLRRVVVETASCNNCHDPLKYHGGARRETGYCALCHTSQLTDPETGQSLEFKVFVHKIHRGKLLPSVREGKPFYVVGAGQQLADYTNLRYPQVVTTDGVHKDLRNCKACHTSSTPQADNWKKFPAVASCTACHDNVDLKSGKNHLLGPQAEGTCSG
jgi:OmcA/MtrC family decaheme c-type cytochrome